MIALYRVVIRLPVYNTGLRQTQSIDPMPAGLLNAQALLNKAAEAAADLELQLPPLNAPLVLQRTLTELAMPQVSN